MSSEPIMSNQQQQSQHGNEFAITEKGRLLDTVVRAASMWNQMIQESCGLCTIYCDRQVKYEEWVQDQYRLSTVTIGMFERTAPQPKDSSEVKRYQEFLFDEESVLESVASRDATED
jgi:hypothetical protein